MPNCFSVNENLNLGILETYRKIWKYKYLNLKYTFRNFKFIQEIQNNSFINENIGKEIIKELCLETRNNYLSKKFYYKWRRFILNKKNSTNHLDLEFNSFDNKNNIIIFDFINNRKYTFTQKEIKKLIENSLFCCHNYEPEPKPVPIKNPYTNLEMTIYQLRDIDKQLGDRIFIWECYKNNNWNIQKLLLNHLLYLQLKCIEYYVLTLDNEDFKYYLDDIVEFIDESQKNKKICKKCIEDFKNYKKKNVINIVIQWIEFLKLKRNAQEMKHTLDTFYKIFDSNCSIHRKIKKKNTKEVFLFSKENTFNFTNDAFEFKSEKPLISVNLNLSENETIIVSLKENQEINKNRTFQSNRFVNEIFKNNNEYLENIDRTIGISLMCSDYSDKINVILYEKINFSGPIITNESEDNIKTI